nr:MAG TPA: hypothetical protein [Caudoviricetes sp.]DAF19132.1 MAG TPA: hypothetical protein [Caudoviricetes sp.]
MSFLDLNLLQHLCLEVVLPFLLSGLNIEVLVTIKNTSLISLLNNFYFFTKPK